MKGTVKFFNTGKGFGFIAGEDGKEYFVHTSAVAEGVTLNENDAVSFDVVQGDRGPKADKVVKDDGSAAPVAADDNDADDDVSDDAEESDEDLDDDEEDDK